MDVEIVETCCSKNILHQTISDPLPNWSCWMILQSAKHLPQCLQTLSGLLHALSVNLILSVKRIGHQWQTGQSQCSLVKVS